jgi:hypothetical protein
MLIDSEKLREFCNQRKKEVKFKDGLKLTAVDSLLSGCANHQYNLMLQKISELEKENE